jgi:hypothetical protein
VREERGGAREERGRSEDQGRSEGKERGGIGERREEGEGFGYLCDLTSGRCKPFVGVDNGVSSQFTKSGHHI